MNDLSISNVHCYVIDTCIITVEDQISRLHFLF